MVYLYDPAEDRRREFWNKLDSRGIKSYLTNVTDVNEPLRRAYQCGVFYTTTHLHEAVTYSNDTLLATEILLENNADPRAKNSDLFTVLQSAIENTECSIETIALLLKYGVCFCSDIDVFWIPVFITNFNWRPPEEKIILLKIYIQFLIVIYPEIVRFMTLSPWHYYTFSHWERKMTSIRNCCIRDWDSSLKDYSNVLYPFCIGEKKALDPEDVRALFDVYVKRKCPHFDELLKVVFETCDIRDLLWNVTLENTVFAEILNADCVWHILSKLNKDSILNFIVAYWIELN
jgi:hypothetical protein